MFKKPLNWLKVLTKTNKIILLIISIICLSFVPIILVACLLGLVLGVPTYCAYKYLKKHPKVTPTFEKIGAVCIFLTVFFGLGILVSALPSTSSTTNNTKTSQSSSSSIDTQSKANSESKAKSDQELADKIRKEDDLKNQLIAKAQIVNQSIDFEENISDTQPIEEVKKANVQIASFGDNTRDKKMFEVLSVVDGDTIKISELGTVRLIGIDTPETKDPRKDVQCFGKEASQYALDNLQGKKVYLEFDPANRIDKYNRTLAYVYRDDGYYYNLEAVKNGFAFAYTKYPNPQINKFLDAQKEAREGSKGLWSKDTCNGESKSVESEKLAITVPAPIQIPQPVVNKVVSTSTPNKIEPAPTVQAELGSSFVEGTCASLKKLGLSRFVPGDANYTSGRDRDHDGIACE